MRLTVVGCSGSYPGPQSPASCYLVQVDADGRTWSALLDFGNGSLGALQNHVELDAIDAVLISHLHPDHCLDLCSYYVVRNYDPLGRFTSRLPVHAPAGAAERITRAYAVDKPEDLSGAYDFIDLADRTAITVGPMTITPHRVNHPVEAYGFRVEADGVVLAYTGDTDTCEALIALERDADLVLSDSAFVDGRDDELNDVHLSGSRAARAAAEAGAKRLMLTHIPSWTRTEDCVRDARTVWAGEVEVAVAGRTYELLPAPSAVETGLGIEHRLAVYGTLAPGRPNEHVMAGIAGTWTAGVVRGTKSDVGWGAAMGYPGITLDDGGDVECVLFESRDLPKHWPMLDDFEGRGYRRVPVQVHAAGRSVKAYIYELSGL